MTTLAQLKLLISLAQIDGKVVERERNFINNIGKLNDITQDEVSRLFEQRHALVVPQDLTDDEKFDHLISMVKLMKIDERMYKEEMLFCSKIAENLGYDGQVMFELLLYVKAGVMEKDEMVNLKEITQKYLKK